MGGDLKVFLGARIAELETQIKHTIVSDGVLASTAEILQSVPGISPVASTMLIAEMPELGQITGAQAAALAGFAPHCP